MSHAPTYHIKTRWQTKSAKSTNICTCPPNTTMNEEQQANVKQIVSDLLTQLHLDMEKDSEHQRNQLHQLQTSLSSHMEENKHEPRHNLQPDYFSGLSCQDAEQFLDIFERISQINAWDENVQ